MNWTLKFLFVFLLALAAAMCTRAFAAGLAPYGEAGTVRDLMQDFARTNDSCRDKDVGCDQRERDMAELKKLGWCYNQAGRLNVLAPSWLACRPAKPDPDVTYFLKRKDEMLETVKYLYFAQGCGVIRFAAPIVNAVDQHYGVAPWEQASDPAGPTAVTQEAKLAMQEGLDLHLTLGCGYFKEHPEKGARLRHIEALTRFVQ